MLVDATSGAGGLPVDIAEADVYYFAPQKGFASDGGLWIALMLPAPRSRGSSEIAASGRWIPAFLDLAHRDRQLQQEPDVQHPAARHAVPDRRSRLDWINGQGGLDWSDAPAPTDSSSRLYAWAEKSRVRHPVRRRRRTRARSSSAPSTSTTRSTPPRSPKVLRANGIVDTEPYRKLGRNQLRVAMFPAVDPDDVEELTQAIDYVVENLVTRSPEQPPYLHLGPAVVPC